MSERERLKRDLLAFVERPNDTDFDALAMRVLRRQVQAVPEYGRLAAASGGLKRGWREAPLVPTDLFRELNLTARDAGAPVKTFQTSGTTSGTRGVRRVPDLDLYHAAMVAPFVRHVLGGTHESRVARWPWFSLIPDALELPDSSLSHMISALAERFAREVWRDKGELERTHGPVIVLATSFALVQMLEADPEWSVRLPAGSRMMLTGGFKGKARELSEDTLLARIEAQLGIPPELVVPEYGMTELTSQAYGRPLEAPPWLKLRVVDPDGLDEVSAGSQGLVAAFDLLNLDNVSAILTGDLGTLDASGRLTLHGRAPGAVLRGCSLTAEELGLA